jgi:type IV pilus assembly protein PilW
LRFNTAIEGYEATNSAPANALNISGNSDPVPFGTAGTWTPSLPVELTASNGSPTPGVVVGSDVIVIRTFDSTGIPITAVNLSTSPATIQVPPAYASQVTQNALYGIADCVKGSVFQASSSANAAGTFTVGVGGLNLSGFDSTTEVYGKNSFNTISSVLYPLRSVAYYIGRGTNGGPALMRLNFSNGCTTTCVPEELVDGIENLQFLYGYDNRNPSPDGAIDVYWTAAQVNNLGGAGLGSTDAAWRRIGSVRFGFISRSLDQAQANNAIAVANASNNVVGTLVTTPDQVAGSADSRLRIVYTTTVALRNHLFGN